MSSDPSSDTTGGGRRSRAKAGARAPALVQRKIRLTSSMHAEVLAYQRATDKADLGEAFRSLIRRGLCQWKGEGAKAGQTLTSQPPVAA